MQEIKQHLQSLYEASTLAQLTAHQHRSLADSYQKVLAKLEEETKVADESIK